MKSILTQILILFCCGVLSVRAQVGDHRNSFAIGLNGGVAMSQVGFVPTVTQNMHNGMTGGVTFRYVSEKYFNTICSVQAELNYLQAGWKENILSAKDQPCINNVSGLAEEYTRNIGYLQLPVFAHLAWGRETKGFQFFVQAGPQVGLKISESTKTNFDYEHALDTDPERANQTVAQESMNVENAFDYGIAGGLGVEYTIPKAGHLQLEGRFYYGLGNLYGDSKKDYFSRSNTTSIVIKMAWLFDL